MSARETPPATGGPGGSPVDLPWEVDWRSLTPPYSSACALSTTCATLWCKKLRIQSGVMSNKHGDPAALRIGPAVSIGQVTSEIGVEIRVVGGLDARLRLLRLLCRRGEFRQPAFVGWIQAEEIILV